MPRGVYQRKSKREMILQAARKVYAYHGFEGSKIELVAEEAGVSKSLVLDQFGSKQELVRAVASQAVGELLEKVREIDATPALTLRRREMMIHDIIKRDREMWCLVLGTVLVPNFQFQQREEITSILPAACETILGYRDELREPSAETARDYAYTTIGLHMAYIVSGDEDNYQAAMDRHFALYLREKL